MEFERRKKIRTHLDIAPLVDVVFQLLIFFLLTSHFIKHPGMKIDLPKAKYLHPQDKIDIVVAVTKDEKIFLNGIKLNKNSFSLRLCELIENNSRKVVTIKADKNVRLQSIIDIMDVANKCNAVGIIISSKLKLEEK